MRGPSTRCRGDDWARPRGKKWSTEWRSAPVGKCMHDCPEKSAGSALDVFQALPCNNTSPGPTDYVTSIFHINWLCRLHFSHVIWHATGWLDANHTLHAIHVDWIHSAAATHTVTMASGHWCIRQVLLPETRLRMDRYTLAALSVRGWGWIDIYSWPWVYRTYCGKCVSTHQFDWLAHVLFRCIKYIYLDMFGSSVCAASS